MTWANLVTCLRLLLIPVVLWCYSANFPHANIWAAALFMIASLSDFLDGYLARRLNQISAFGAFLDPVADKLLVAMALIMLVAAYPVLLPAAGLIIARELLISALREWMAGQGKRDAVAVAFTGKLKTTVQMIAIVTLMLASATTPDWLFTLGLGLIYSAALLSLWSMAEYFRNAWRELFPG